MKRNLISVTLLFLSTAVFGQANSDTFALKSKAFESLDIKEDISLVKLITNPENYDGKKIKVIVYLHLEFEGDAIYLHKEDYDNSLSKNGFWVDFSPSLTKLINPDHYNNKYVFLIGTFDSKHKGHMDLFGGTIRDISWIHEWGTWKKR
ncbi:MAG: hypothetical protein ABI685_06240 [Ferruginibacter sp.]